MLARKLRTARRTLTVARNLALLDDDELGALHVLARATAEEHVTARRAPGISETAIISPLASLRFTDRVDIGPKASIGPYCCIWGGWSRTRAVVGAGALLSPGVVLVAGNHRIDEPGPVRDTGFEELDVEVAEGAWVGAHAVVVGCRVGVGAVVGAGAVVLKDVPDGAIAVGAPARVVGQRPVA